VFDATALPAAAEELLSAARVEPTVPVLSDLLRVVFGFRDFRDGQLQAIQNTLAGHACLAILPTGQGKSLCYQVRRRELCIVFKRTTDTKPEPSRSYRHSCSQV
jgi:superfamily II DNA/RNA helicase